MKPFRKIITVIFITSILSISGTGCGVDTASDDNYMYIPVEPVTDKIRGGMLGQILGNLNGLPHENEYFYEPGNVTDYVPALPDGGWTDDDTDIEWIYIYEMQNRRKVLLSPEEITSFWQEKINRRIWCSNGYARYLMDIGIEPPYTGFTPLNPWAGFNISGMFIAETFALTAPAMPQTAAKIGLNYATVAISAEPAQATQLFTTMISTAFIEDDIDKILDAGIAALDPESVILQIINDVKSWHSQFPDNWRDTRRLIKETYTLEGDTKRTRNWNGVEINTATTIAALLYGEGDFARTLELCFNMGWDADNTAAMAGTILGVKYGYRKMVHNWTIIDRYKNTTRDNMPMDETITSFSDRVIEVFEMVNQENGGEKIVKDSTMVYKIPSEVPAPIVLVTSPEDQKNQLVEKFKQEIISNLQHGNREERARAAYMAVALDLYENISSEYPDQWGTAAYDLSGYWKIMDNIFFGLFGDFNEMHQLKDKFIAAGFKTPAKDYRGFELFNDPEVWKDPDELY